MTASKSKVLKLPPVNSPIASDASGVELSIILPIYNERENIDRLLAELEDAVGTLGKSFEVIAVDDGSNDGTTELLQQRVARSPYLRVITFRQNAGQTAAFEAGFRYASGSLIVTMDADLQNDPRDIGPMIQKLVDEKIDLVCGWRKNRFDNIVRKIPSRIANWMIRKATGTKVNDLGCSLKVIRREICNELKLYGEMHRFIPILAKNVGAEVGEYVVNHRPRVKGKSKYGFNRIIKVILDLLTVCFLRHFQAKPIYVFGTAGLALIGAGALTAGYVLWERLALEVWVHRNPLFILSVMFTLIGSQFAGMGIIAELIIRTYFESSGKRTFVVEQTHGFPEEPKQP